MFAVAALDLVHGNVGLEDAQAGNRREGEAVNLASGEEHRLADVVELEVRLHLIEVEVVFCLADLLGIIAIVPRRDLEAAARDFGAHVDERLHHRDVGVDLRHRRLPRG